MKFNFFKSKKEKINSHQKEEEDSMGFTNTELAEYDKHVRFYFTNIINSLILFTYSAEQLDKMTPILIDPLTELFEELQYAFTPVCFETVFRNNFIEQIYKEDLLIFKNKVENVPNEIWEWDFLDKDETWIQLRTDAEFLLNKLGITSRTYNDEFTTIIKI